MIQKRSRKAGPNPQNQANLPNPLPRDTSQPIGEKPQHGILGQIGQDPSSIERDVANPQDTVVRPSTESEEVERLGVLTAKQIQVIQTARRERGWGFKRIAREYGLGIATVYKYTKHIVPVVFPEQETEEP